MGPGGAAGPRRDLSDSEQALLETMLGAIWVGVILAFGLLVAGWIVDARARARERQALRIALADPAAPPPEATVLQRHTLREPLRLSQTLAAISGAGLVVSLTPILTASGYLRGLNDTGGGSTRVSHLGLWWLLAVFSVLLLVAALVWNGWAHTVSGKLRAELITRWPVPPDPKRDTAAEIFDWRIEKLLWDARAWRRGPTLTPDPDQDAR